MNKFIQELMDEYDSQLDKAYLHRVARQVLDPASKVRQMLQQKVANCLPLEAMPELWTYIVPYAFSLRVSSKNEGDHRTIKCEARVANNIALPAYLCAHLRKGDCFRYTRNEAFIQFAQKLWHRRGTRELSSCLLQGYIPSSQLVSMGWSKMVRHIYQFDVKEQYCDTQQVSQSVALHKRHVKEHCTAPPVVASASEALCVQFLKAVLAEGVIYSLPAAVFNLCTARPAGTPALAEPFDVIDIVTRLFQDSKGLQTECSSEYFEVVNANPEYKVQAAPSHVPVSRTKIRTRTHAAVREGVHRIVRPSTAGPLELDLLPLCQATTFPAAVSQLQQWRRDASAVMPKLHPSATHRTEAAMMDRIQASNNSLFASAAQPGQLQQQSHLLDLLVSANAVTSALADQWMPFSSVNGVRLDVVQELLALGILEAGQDEFGELTVAANVGRFSYEPVDLIRADQGAFLAACSKPCTAQTPKLLAVAMLMCTGWSLQANAEEPLTCRSPRVARASLPLETLWYYRALLQIDEIFLKPPGHVVVYHGLPAAYYACLVEMDDLSQLHKLGESVRRVGARGFNDIMAGKEFVLQAPGSAADAAASAMEVGLEMLEDGFGELFIPHGAVELEEIFGHAPLVSVRQPLKFHRHEGEQGTCTVNFDRCTHASGNQRAFIDCPWHRGEHCRRYVFCCNFASHLDAAAWLAAWAFCLPRAACKADHYKQEPSDVDVQTYKPV